MPPDDVPSRFAVDFTGATLLGIYRVENKIADGGMGSVWLGEDTNLGREVVVKVPHVRFLGESGFRARFTREITELVRLEHPNIVRILAQGTHEEIPFFVLQYLGGGSLEDRLADAGQGPRGTDAVAPWLRTIAATLDFVHGRGVVHRDVKPENILFDEEGHVFLSDFGVVKALDEDLNVTEAGTGVGSPKYMAPEQGLGRPVEGAADQYGLATAVYEAITGRLPFEGGNLRSHAGERRPDPRCASARPARRRGHGRPHRRGRPVRGLRRRLGPPGEAGAER
jgi:serine/threonine-protein kinase